MSSGSRKPVDVDGKESQTPLYLEIKNSIASAIRAGQLRPGDRVPSEAELVESFGVSRMTANRALREMQAAGLLVHEAGKGSFVAPLRPIGQMIEIRNIADEVRDRGHHYRARVIEQLSAPAVGRLAGIFGVRQGTELYHTRIVHHENEFPIQFEDRHVLASAVPGYIEQDFEKLTPSEYLTRVAPLERVEHHLRAVMPDKPLRQLLAVGQNTPVLEMTRRTWSAAIVASYAILVHPADRFELSAVFEPSSAMG